MHCFEKQELEADDSEVERFAQMYVDQRTASFTPAKTLQSNFLFKSTGFDAKELERIITKNVIAEDKKREAGLTPDVLNDIYRSDLGELLMTHYFEEVVEPSKRFKIPVKNISSRELAQLPGRGMDAIGYRIAGGKIYLLFGEAKVSHSSDSPPAVVHATNDSIYKTHLKHKPNLTYAIKKLTDYFKRLSQEDAAIIGMAILMIEQGMVANYEITLGCALVRDHICVNEAKDFGKMKTNVGDFAPHKVHFGLISFRKKTIEEIVKMFYEKVHEKAA